VVNLTLGFIGDKTTKQCFGMVCNTRSCASRTLFKFFSTSQHWLFNHFNAKGENSKRMGGTKEKRSRGKDMVWRWTRRPWIKLQSF